MLRFLSVLLGPIFAKEMVEMSRRKRYYFNRVLYGLVLLFTLFVVWQEYRWRFQGGTMTIRVMADFAETLFHAVSSVQYGAVFLFVPLFLCGVIASEREERTLDLLFTTQLQDRQIVLGKLVSRTVALIILILCALPVMSILMLFGGIDPDGLWRIQGATLLAILYAGAHAIYFSAITRSPMGALVRTYWWMAVWIVGVPLVTVLILSGLTRGPMTPAWRFVMAGLFLVNPMAPFVAALEGGLYNQMASFIGFWFFPAAFIVPGAWSCFLIWRGVRRLRLPPSSFNLIVTRLRPVRSLRSAFHRFTDALARTSSRLSPFRRPVRNPFWLRARRARVYDREGYIGRIQWLAWFAAGLFLLVILAFHANELGRPGTGIAFLVIGWVFLAALTVIIAGTSLVGDRRRGFLDLVLITTLTPRNYIDGTLLAVWEHLRRTYWLILVLALFFGLTGASTWAGLFCSLLTATLFCALMALYGVVFSLPAKTIPAALVPTFLFPVLMNLGIVFFMTLRNGGGPALWVLSGLALLGAWYWIRRRATAASVAAFFMAVHLVLTSAALCWTWAVGHREYPMAAMHPGHLAFAPLDGRGGSWYHGLHDRELTMLACYWSALVVNFVWARSWAIRNFDRLVERTGMHDQAAPLAGAGAPGQRAWRRWSRQSMQTK